MSEALWNEAGHRGCRNLGQDRSASNGIVGGRWHLPTLCPPGAVVSARAEQGVPRLFQAPWALCLLPMVRAYVFNVIHINT